MKIKKNMILEKKRKMVIRMIETTDEARLDAIMTLLTPVDNNSYVRESDWAEIEYRQKQVEEGKVKDVDAKKSAKRIRALLNRKKK